MAVRLNVQRLIDDLGGVAELTQRTGITRTAPYRWRRQEGVSSYCLEKIVDAYPDVDLNVYFERCEPSHA